MSAASDEAPDGVRELPDAATAALILARSLHQFLNLGVAQLDAAVRESDAQVDKIAQSLAAITTDMQQFDSGAGSAELVASVPRAVGGQLESIVSDPDQFAQILERATVVAFDELFRDGQ